MTKPHERKNYYEFNPPVIDNFLNFFKAGEQFLCSVSQGEAITASAGEKGYKVKTQNVLGFVVDSPKYKDMHFNAMRVQVLKDPLLSCETSEWAHRVQRIFGANPEHVVLTSIGDMTKPSLVKGQRATMVGLPTAPSKSIEQVATVIYDPSLDSMYYAYLLAYKGKLKLPERVLK